MEEFQFEPLTIDDYSEVLGIYRKSFEDAPWVDTILHRSLSREGKVGVKLVENGKIIGMLLTTRGIFLTHANSELYHRISKLTIGLDVYTAGMIYVDPSARRHGLGMAMFREVLRLLKEKKVDYMFCEMATDKDGKYPGESVLRSNTSYVFLGEFKNYYKDTKVSGTKPCLACGKNPCECSARFYLFEI